MADVRKDAPSVKGRERDMTRGGIAGNIIKFALPLLAGNLFQQLYNMVDTWVIGQTGDNGAYAAVGSVGPILNILIGLFVGLSGGAGVVISQYFGAKDREKVRLAVHTAMALTFILGVVFTALGIFMAPYMLRLMLRDVSENDIFVFAKQYLTIYFSGVTGMLIYNMGSGILRAVGDSKRPLYFLMVSAVTNTVLDFVFVFRFGLGAAGVAWATVIAQAASALFVCYELFFKDSCVRVYPRELKIDGDMLKKIVKIGFPAAIQMALTAFANVFVQSYIASANGSQSVNLGGWTTYSKVDQLIFLPVQSISLSVMTFVGQNLGAGQIKRAKQGTLTAYLISTVCTVAIMVPVMLLRVPVSGLFNSDPAVVDRSALLLRIITPFYLFCSINQIFSSSLRGAGNSRAPMLIMMSSFIVIRQIYLFIVSNYISNDLIPIAVSYPVGWICCSIGMIIYYLHFDFGSKKVVNN